MINAKICGPVARSQRAEIWLQRILAAPFFSVAIATLLVVMVGCVPTPAEPTSDGTNLGPNIPKPPSRVRVTVIESNIAVEEVPSTVEEFVAQFAKRVAQDPERAFIDLTYWGNASQADRKRLLDEFLYVMYDLPTSERPGKLNHEALVLKTVKEYGDFGYVPSNSSQVPADSQPVKFPQLQHVPSHILQVRINYSESHSGTNYYAIGAHDGKFYFCSTRTE